MRHFAKTRSSRSSGLLIALSTLVACIALCASPVDAVPQAFSAPPDQSQSAPSTKPADQKANSTSQTPVKQKDPSNEDNKLGLQTIKNIVRDQRQIWTSPAHIRLGHADWLVPYAGLTAGFLVTDRDASLHLSNSPSTLKHYRDFSNYGLAGIGGTVGGLYLWGKATNDPHKQETGILSGEAAVNALLVTEVLKYSFGRLFTKILAYGAASAISISRVEGKRHFPSDALVGSGIGWFAGWQAYHVHHNRELGGGIAEGLSDTPQIATDRTPRRHGFTLRAAR